MADTGNSRLLWFEQVPQDNNRAADGVWGPPDFTTGSENAATIHSTDHALYWPFCVAASPSHLAAADTGNHRIIVVQRTSLNGHFHHFEAVVGVALVVLGAHRLYRMRRPAHPEPQASETGYQVAYSVGLIHGLAGSGTMVLLVMSEIEGVAESLAYLLVFGLGSVAGMLAAAGVFSLPFARKIAHRHASLRTGFVLLSSLLCLGYGSWIIIKNLA